ncbi:polymorphic toxin-type HINT domain-containing protein [Nonomuraea salmonea]|uniref:Polymorphic toxin-type HINT domain-containing protein n=1 Tax=Nonomuraea salmonea TaxID=46181 RepID=A0ABV5NP18_9ACTN
MVLEEAEVADIATAGVDYDGLDYDGDLLCRSMISCAKDVVEELGENAAEDIADKVIEEVIDATIPDVPVDAPGTTCALPNSFVPGTPVLMADGSTKPIEKVEAGDEVVATDPATGRTESRPVVALISSKGVKKLVDITVTVDGAKDVITATDNHPFWVPKRKAWLTAGALQPGMWLQTSAGTYVQITAIEHRTATQRVHNLTVEDFHTYHVVAGDQDVLVHNSTPPDPNVGTYSELAPSGVGKERHHILPHSTRPAGSSYGKGPTIRMDRPDHRALYSTGSSLESKAWRQWQTELINAGKHAEAMEMEYRDILQRFPGKYDHEINVHRTNYAGGSTCP